MERSATCRISFRRHQQLVKCGENQRIETVVLIFSLRLCTCKKKGVDQVYLTRGTQEDVATITTVLCATEHGRSCCLIASVPARQQYTDVRKCERIDRWLGHLHAPGLSNLSRCLAPIQKLSRDGSEHCTRVEDLCEAGWDEPCDEVSAINSASTKSNRGPVRCSHPSTAPCCLIQDRMHQCAQAGED